MRVPRLLAGSTTGFLLAALLCAPTDAPAEIVWGADLSSWSVVGESPTACCAVGPELLDPLEAWRRGGGTWTRVRIWNDPPTAHGSRAAALALARRATELDLQVLLALHLSDTWADPGRQDTPAAWRDASVTDLADSLHAFTTSVLRGFRAAGVRVDAVQIGNEIDAGLLWPLGRWSSDGAGTPKSSHLPRLLRAAAKAVRAESQAKFVLHTTAPAAALLVHLRDRGLDFDVAGLSYYPWWHGDLDQLERMLIQVRDAIEKPVWLVESAYPHTLDWNDTTHNAVGMPAQLLVPFAATPEGQHAYFEALYERFHRTIADGVLFVFEPAWVSAPHEGSPWENLAWFDFSGRPLPVWSALRLR